MLRNSIKGALLAFAVIPLIFVALVAVPRSQAVIEEIAFSKLHSSALSDSALVNQIFKDCAEQAQLISIMPVFDQLVGATSAERMTSEYAQYRLNFEAVMSAGAHHDGGIDTIMVYDSRGMVLASTTPHLVGRMSPVPLTVFTQLKPNEMTYSGMLSADSLQGIVASASSFASVLPVYEEGQHKGFVVYVHNGGFFKTLSEEARAITGNEVAIVDTSGLVIMDKGEVFPPEYLSTPEGVQFAKSVDMYGAETGVSSGGDGEVFEFYIDGKKMAGHVDTVELSGWRVIAMMDYKDLVAPSQQFLLIMGVTAFGIALLAWIFSFILADMLVGPLENKFMPTIHALANGDRDARVDYLANDEMGYVARALNDVLGELSERESQLIASESRYRIVLEENQDIVFEWDWRTDTITFSPMFKQKFGFEPPSAQATEVYRRADFIHPDDQHVNEKFCDDAFLRHIDSRAELRIRKANGDYLWVAIRTVVLNDAHDEYHGFLGVMTDIDNHKKEEARLLTQVKIDMLSKVFNRRAFETESIEEIAIAQSRGGQVALLFVDLDDFKDFNTLWGHAFGDRVIRFCGEVLSTIVGDAGLVGRVGGDEFAICITNQALVNDTASIVEEISDVLSVGIPTREGLNQPVFVSIGTAILPQDGTTYEDLMHAADLDMYQIKAQRQAEKLARKLYQLEESGEAEAT